MTEKKHKTSPPKRSSKSSSLSVIVITVFERLDYERAQKKIAGAGHIGKRR
jgi:hypothetical protein